jgi:hypothetical protein
MRLVLGWLLALILVPSLTWAQKAARLSSRDTASIYQATLDYLIDGEGIKHLGPARVVCISEIGPLDPTPWLGRISASDSTPKGRLVLYERECNSFASDRSLSPSQANVYLTSPREVDSAKVVVYVGLTVAITESEYALLNAEPRQVQVVPGPRAAAVDVYLSQGSAGWRVDGAFVSGVF